MGVAQAAACGTVTANTTLGSDCDAPLTIGASGITVDLGGHSVLCPAVPGSTGIDVGSWDGVRVENRSVNGCTTGVLVNGGDSEEFTALALSDNDVGFDIRDSADSTVERNEVTNSPFTGVLLFQTSGITVRRNTILDGGTGIFDNGGTNNRIMSNTAAFGDTGIIVGAESAIVVHNSTPANNRGIWVTAAHGVNRLFANESLGNSIFDMQDDAPGCDSNVWHGNKFATANQPCIH